MAIDIGKLRESLRDIPDALADTTPSEPAWVSQASEEDVLRVEQPVILSEDGAERSSIAPFPVASGLINLEERKLGVEALAWYRTFRSPSDKQWGIFIRADGIAAFYERMFSGLPATRYLKLELAFYSLLAHELTHFYIDAAMAQFELLTSRAIWLPRRQQFVRAGKYDTYEEMIANASMLRAVRAFRGPLRVKGRERALRAWTRTQPDGYKTGYRHTSAPRFAEALDKYGIKILKGAVPDKARRARVTLSPLVQGPMLASEAKVPLFIVYGSGSMRYGDIGLFPSVRIVSETTGFKKQLAKSPREMQSSYASLKARLLSGAPSPGDHFKKWRPLGETAWSLRLNRGDRVHVRHLAGIDFEAIEIGSHRALGHG